MIVKHYTDVPAAPAVEGQDITIRWLISRPEGAPNFAMRLFELQPGASSPHHRHAEEHEVFILAGQGQVEEDGRFHPIAAGDFVFVPPDETHQFTNTGQEVLRFICVIPL